MLPVTSTIRDAARVDSRYCCGGSHVGAGRRGSRGDVAADPGCDIRLSYISRAACTAAPPNLQAELIFGDSILLKQLRESEQWHAGYSLANGKFIWVTVGDERVAHSAKIAGEIDEHVRFECRKYELFALA